MKKCLLLIFFLQSLLVYPSTTLTPEIKTYNAIDYKSHNKNWSIVSDSLGYLYCANHKGLLQFDGHNWELYQLPNKGVIRSVFIDSKGHIYTGSLEEFGYWERDDFGQLHYTSLSALLNDFEFHNQEIWKIIEVNSIIYFHSFNDIFYYNQQQLFSIKNLAAPSFLMEIESKAMTQLNTGELIALSCDNIEIINQKGLIKDAELKTSIALNSTDYLIGSGFKGLFLYNNKNIWSWYSEINDVLQNKQINKILVNKDNIYIATNQHGLYISNKKGEIIDHINTDDALVSNSIQDMCFDKNNKLWLAHNGGISRINLNPSIQYITDSRLRIGAVYSAAVHHNNLYLGTDIGVFKHPYTPQKHTEIRLSAFELIEELIGQTWSLDIIDKQLFCGHTNGTYIINTSSIDKISDIEGGFCFRKTTIGENEYLFQGTYSGIVLFTKDANGNWTFDQKYDNYTEPTKQIEIDYLGNIWATHYAKNGFFKLELSDDHKSIDTVHIYKESIFNTDKKIHISTLGGRVCFLSQQGMYAFNDLENKFQPLEDENNQLKRFKSTNKIERLGHDYAFSIDDEIGVFGYSSKTLIPKFNVCLPHISIVENSKGIINLNSNTLLLCLENGIALVDKERIISNSKSSTQIKFRRIVATKQAKLMNLVTSERAKLTFRNNFISFHFSADNLKSEDIIFSYQLEGLDNTWHNDPNTYQANYSRLPWGDYRFRVRAKDIYDNSIDEITYPFTIAPPFYASTLAYIIYFLLLLFIIYVVMRYSKKAVERERKRNQAKILALENDNLKKDIKFKSKELASIMLGTIRKNEALTDIIKTIEKQKSDLPEKSYKSIIRAIKQRMSNKKDLEKFEEHFDSAYNNFFKKLKAEYPNLSSNDLRLCAYLRMNLSTKELASLMNISVRGLETHRYRLRKKLQLTPETNLIDFILSLA